MNHETSSGPPQALKAVLLDWAGTTIDYGSRAPARVFIEIFRQSGIDITVAEAREPMGMAKRAHIAAVLAMPRVAALWRQQHGGEASEGDIDRLYQQFLPLQKATLADHSDLIPGVVEAIEFCRQRHLKIGSTTGYTRELMEVVRPLAAAAGYQPDACVCSDDVSAGRPAPWSNFRAAELLDVYPPSSILVVDDTPAGIAAGRNSAMWTVAVTQTGNALGLSSQEVAALPPDELESRLAKIEADFRAGGAHDCIRSVAELPRLIASWPAAT